MGFTELIGNFMKGLGTTIARASAIKEILSSAVADGIENGMSRSMPLLMKNIILAGFFLTGTFLFGLGIAKWAESMIATPGAGFMATGIVLFLAACLYMKIKGRAE